MRMKRVILITDGSMKNTDTNTVYHAEPKNDKARLDYF